MALDELENQGDLPCQWVPMGELMRSPVQRSPESLQSGQSSSLLGVLRCYMFVSLPSAHYPPSSSLSLSASDSKKKKGRQWFFNPEFLLQIGGCAVHQGLLSVTAVLLKCVYMAQRWAASTCRQAPPLKRAIHSMAPISGGAQLVFAQKKTPFFPPLHSFVSFTEDNLQRILLFTVCCQGGLPV